MFDASDDPDLSPLDDLTSQKPIIHIRGDKNRRLLFDELGVIEESGMHASVSHEKSYAVAVVTLEKYETVEVKGPKGFKQ